MDSPLGIVAGFLSRPGFLWSVFLAVLALFGAATWVLFYHWDSYLVRKQAVVTAKTLYIVVAMGLIASAFVSLFAI